MLSGNRLEKRTLGNDQTYKDYQDTSENDTLYNTIKAGLIVAAGYGLYKSGALKVIAKPLLELADNVAREGGDRAANVMNTVKQWSNLKHLTPEQLKHSKLQNYNAPSRSIFRDRDSSMFYDLFQDVNEISRNRQANFHRMREIIEDTRLDMDNLQRMIRENQANLPNQRMNYLNTDLHYYMKELQILERDAREKAPSQYHQFTAKAIEEFMNTRTLTSKQAAQELRESGYRQLVLGDIVEMVRGEDGIRRLVTKENAGINLGVRANEEYQSLLENINTFFTQSSHNYIKDGKRVNALASGDWQNIILDSSIRISETGHIIDYRMSRDNMIAFAHSLANDFKLPLVQFNPFKSLLGWDKKGRRDPLMGLISGQQFDANITRVGGRKTINDWMVETLGKEYDGKHVAVINGKAFTTDANGQLQELGSGFKLHDITHADEHYGLRPLTNATRQMSGLSMGEAKQMFTNEYAEYLKSQYDIDMSTFQKAKHRFGRWLDIGYQEVHPDADNVILGLDSASSIDEATNRFITWLTDRPLFKSNGYEYDDVQKMINAIRSNDNANFKTAFGKGFDKYIINGKEIEPRMFTTTKEGFKIRNAFNYYRSGDTNAAAHEMEGFAKQFFVGRNADNTMHEFFTERSGITWTVLNQLSEGLGSASNLLGLSIDSKRSTTNLFLNLLGRRALPVYAALQIPGIINYLSEPFFGPGDETGNRDNITKFMMRNVVKPIDINAHHAMDLVGATKLFKFLGEMVPGVDQLGVHDYGLGLTQTGEERKEYIENGYEPMRKGRYWGSGNTPWTGGKIMYFRPNIYRRVEADVEFSDSKWGSRQEYYNNTWYPNPVNPLAPVNHFILDRNHYDKKHYYDRPYLQTASEGQNIPIIGPLFSSTIGKIINPPQKMHLEYWQKGFQVNPADELPHPLMVENKTFDNSKLDINTFNRIEQGTAINNVAYHNDLYTSAYQAKQVTSKSFIEKAGITFEQRSILPVRTYDRYNTPYEVYSTPSGSLNVVDIPDEMNLYNVNQDLQRYSINKVLGTNQRITRIDDFSGPGIPVGNDSPSIDNAFMYGLGEQYNWLGNVAGLKGFAVQTFITGSPNQKARIIEDSGYAYSFNNDFWEANLGGAGGNLSEITRRFIPKRNNKTEYVNPIRNTMPSWMPGCFIAGTNVFTENGVSNIENLQIGQKVYDHNGELQQIEYVHQGQYNGDMVSIKVKGICNSITATGNHPFYVVTSNYCSYRNSRMCIPGVHPNNNKPCRYCKNKQWSSFEWKEARNLKEGDYLAIAIPQNKNDINELIISKSKRKMTKDISDKHIPLDFNFGVFTGFYLSEGHAHPYGITFGSGKCEPEQVKSVEYIANLLGLNFSSKNVYNENNKGCIVTNIHSKQLSELMKDNFGHLSFNKTLPSWMFNTPVEYQMGVIAGMIQGDGSVGVKKGLLLNSVSYSLLHNTLLVLAQNNICSTIHSTINDYGHKAYTLSISQRDAVTLKYLTNGYGTKISQVPDDYPKNTGCSSVIYNGYLLRKIDSIDKYNDNVTVYNLQIANSHTYNVEGVSVHNSNYFTDFKHGDPYSKIDNGEERLPGEGYERLHNIKGLMEFNIGSSSIGYEKDYIIRHMLKADKYMNTFEEDTLEKGNEIHTQLQKVWKDAGLAISTEGKVEDKRNGIIGWYDAMVHDMSSPTGVAIVDIKSTSAKKLDEIRKSGKPLTHHMRQTNFYLWTTGNTQSKGYIHYVDKENLNNTYTVGFNYSQEELDKTLQNVHEARQTIRKAIEKGEIGRGELYSTLDRFRILADVAPYSQEFKDVSAQLSSEDLSPEEQEEASQIRERVKQQKEPLRVYPYKFKTSNLKSETVTVAKIIDNNTIVTKEYGKKHSIKFAGINVSMSNSEMFDEKRTKNDAARDAVRQYIRPGAKIRISYDADERNKYSKDSTRSIRAVVHSRGQNVNKVLLERGHAKENEDDNSPAAIRARYTKGEIAFGSAMETTTHSIIGRIPFIGSKFMQVRSPYEQYRKREVYGKDFQSWNHPIRDMLIPAIEENIADNSLGGLGGILMGGFIGSMFGKSRFGTIVGAVAGALLPAVGKIAFVAGSDKDKDWRPKRRREQEKLNEYVDVLKYVKNMRLYEQYKTKAKKEDHFDVESFMKSKEMSGVKNKLRQKELIDYKRKVKLDFKHRDRYNFKHGEPKYVEKSMDKKQTIKAVNQELVELQSQRKVTKVPVNALKAIEFKQAADQTMYAYNPGDSLVNIMTALPKKERQYFKHFMDAPEEEKQKILRIAPSYLRRALQSTWGMTVDKKPSLAEYFQTHGLPDASWVGWDENTDIQDVKVKLVHQNNLDPGEFDIWDDGERKADETNIPIPMIDAKNSPRQVQLKLNQILGKAGYDNIQTDFMQSTNGNKTSFFIKRDARNEVSQQIAGLNI